ncbi:hypothetical protein BJ956_001518 [Arthrobacter psychrochitiniphilus]|nr:hypothetical protein [Arthrobacter psychrochitiniphilus]
MVPRRTTAPRLCPSQLKPTFCATRAEDPLIEMDSHTIRLRPRPSGGSSEADRDNARGRFRHDSLRPNERVDPVPEFCGAVLDVGKRNHAE